jgi:hypothetical protein
MPLCMSCFLACTRSGLTDDLAGAATVFLYALLTGGAFLMVAMGGSAYEMGFSTPNIDWRVRFFRGLLPQRLRLARIQLCNIDWMQRRTRGQGTARTDRQTDKWMTGALAGVRRRGRLLSRAIKRIDRHVTSSACPERLDFAYHKPYGATGSGAHRLNQALCCLIECPARPSH